MLFSTGRSSNTRPGAMFAVGRESLACPNDDGERKPLHSCREISFAPASNQARSGGFSQLVQEMKKGHADDGVQQSEHECALDFERNRAAQQAAREHPVQELVEEVEEERQQEPDHGV